MEPITKQTLKFLSIYGVFATILATLFIMAMNGSFSKSTSNNEQITASINKKEDVSQEEETTQNLNTTSDGWKNEGTVDLIKKNARSLGTFPIQSKGNIMRVYMDYQYCDSEYLKVHLNPKYEPYSYSGTRQCRYMAGPYYILNFNKGE